MNTQQGMTAAAVIWMAIAMGFAGGIRDALAPSERWLAWLLVLLGVVAGWFLAQAVGLWV